MRRKWYTAFGVLLLAVLLFFVMLHDTRWFFFLLTPLIILWIYDVTQTDHTILRNFPVLGHIRFILEFIRPEIQQYFIANNMDERPYNRQTRSIIYQRAKNIRDTVPFGTELNLRAPGYTWVLHSLAPKKIPEGEARIMVGGPACKQPYLASRINISAMSFGSLSERAIQALNEGAKIGNFAHNTGEGGISPYHLNGGDLIFQIGTAYFGCRDDKGNFDPIEFEKEANRSEVKMIEIKLSQGAKPSHGGILPAAKLTPEIALARKVKMGQDVVSPQAHSAFSTPRELLIFIQKLREISGGKPIGFKLCLGRRKEFLGICKAMLETGILPDFITIDGAEGGTGAAPLEYSNHVGEPLEEALVFIHNSLVGINLREHIRIICSGKIATGFDVVEKIALGANMCNLARPMMLAMGCIQSKQCNANTCPTGITTQNKRLQRGLVVEVKKQRVANYHHNTMKSFLEIVGAIGLSNPSELSPEYLIRRINDETVTSLAELYSYVKPGDFFGGNLDMAYKKYWDLADPDQF